MASAKEVAKLLGFKATKKELDKINEQFVAAINESQQWTDVVNKMFDLSPEEKFKIMTFAKFYSLI